MVPSKLQKAERDIDDYQKKYDSIQQLKPVKENVSINHNSSYYFICITWNLENSF